MINKLFVATSNAHKLHEIKEILKEFGMEVELLCPKDINDNSEPIEDGKTFKENASIKANFWFNKTHLPTIADDSGICIEYLNNFPGIYSARFMNKFSYFEKNSLIIKALSDAPTRKASFHAGLSYIDENGEEVIFEGILNGEIADKIHGENGFGYDPIFFLKEYGKTTAELSPEEKNRVSHRYLALRQWAEYVKNK